MTTTELPELPNHYYTEYDRQIAPFEDGGAIVQGHDRRSWAAASWWMREQHGRHWRRNPKLKNRVEARWFIAEESCGCTEEQHELHGAIVADDHPDADEEYPEAYAECYEHCECYGLPPCNDQYSWMALYVAETAEGAIPVLHIADYCW